MRRTKVLCARRPDIGDRPAKSLKPVSTRCGVADPAGKQLNDEWETPLTPAFVRRVVAALDQKNGDEARGLVLPLRPADCAELLDLLRPDERRYLVEVLGADLHADVLSELDEGIRDDVMELLDSAVIVAALQEMETDDAVYVVEDMDKREQREILAQLPADDRAAIEQSLEYPEDSAGRLMQRELVAVPPFWDVGQMIDYMRKSDDLPDEFYEIFVVDPSHRPVGTLPLYRAMRSSRDVKISDLMIHQQTLLGIEMDREDVARKFEKYDLISAAVVDAEGRLVGVITVDDIVEVIADEASEDIMLMGGVGSEESVTDSVFETTRGRFSWLFLNLLTAIVASLVISLFDATIEHMVALAVLMPIVASMGGNAGTQTMTIAVRSLATRDLVSMNARRIVTREVLVGLANGLMFAGLMGVIGGLWFSNLTLGLVLAAAMVVNMAVAGLAGILIPLGLEKMKVDPAVSSAVFLTTVTDVVGFFAFLGMAAIWLV